MTMNSKDCLTEQELTLHYYGELDASRSLHLADCQQCTEHLGALTAELAKLPKTPISKDYYSKGQINPLRQCSGCRYNSDPLLLY
jgi:hypothetical protein